MAVCLCSSQVSVQSKWMGGSSWVLARRLLSTYPALNLCICKNKGTSRWKFVQTPDFEQENGVH